jgi:hypothetical protein
VQLLERRLLAPPDRGMEPLERIVQAGAQDPRARFGFVGGFARAT